MTTDPRLVSRAEQIFADLLVKSPSVSDEELARAASGEPELANELALLHRQWRRFDSSRERLVSAPSDAARALEPRAIAGKCIDRFECRRLLGRGGMGEVWEAEELDLKRRVALKLLPHAAASSPEDVARFRREAEATSRVRHDSIVSVHSAGESEGCFYIAYELVEGGRSLREWIDERAKSAELSENHYREVAELFESLASALAAAHDAGIVHRDLKPQNVLMTSTGRPKVADFGLAKVSGELSLSRTGSFLGTWLYASPEQVRGDSDLGPASDVFSLGVTLYECLTLRRPFDGDTRQQVVARILNDDPIDPRKLRSRCPKDLAVICSKALEKSPDRRYRSMRALADDLHAFLSNRPIAAREPSALERAQKWLRRHPTAAATIGVSTAAFAALVWMLVQTLESKNAAETAQASVRQSNQSLREANQALEVSRREALAAAAHASEEAARARRESDVRSQMIAFMARMFDAANPDSFVDQEPKAHELVESAAAELRAGALEATDVRAPMMLTVAKLFDKLGRFDDAQSAAIESIALFEQDPPPGSGSDLDYARWLLAAELGRHADFQASLEVLEPMLERARRDPDASCNWLADLLYARGTIFVNASRMAEGEADLREVQDVDRIAADRDELTKAVDQNDLGGVYLVENRLQDADPWIASALATLTRQLGESNVRTLNAANSLGLIRRYRGDLAGAAEIFEHCVAAAGKIYRADHADFLVLRMNLAQVWIEQKRFDEAERAFRELVDTSARSLGERDPNTLTFLAGLGACLNRAQRYEDAERVNRQLFEDRMQVFGANHRLTLESENNLAFALQGAGRLDEALKYQEDVVRRTSADDGQADGRRRMLESIRDRLAKRDPAAGR